MNADPGLLQSKQARMTKKLMLNIEQLKQTGIKILSIGSHPGIIQSMLDFDYLSGKTSGSVKVIIASGRRFERYFFGKREIFIPVYSTLAEIPEKLAGQLNFAVNVSSARRVLSATSEVFDMFPQISGCAIFAEDVPEKHALELAHKYSDRTIIGPASVGILVPNVFKIGAIGGVDYRQLIDAHLFESGSVAVFSASGGMTNEIINIVTKSGSRLSFALHFGGDRFPITAPLDAFMAAEQDAHTKTIVYYGELGGYDEYKIAELLSSNKITKQVICYIAGTISDLFETPPQFGHAKAMASSGPETARAKRDALKNAGAQVAESFTEFVELIHQIPTDQKRISADVRSEEKNDTMGNMDKLSNRRHALIATSISQDKDGVATILGEDVLSMATDHSFGYIVASMFLGKKIKSRELEEFVDFVLRLLVDHGPYVSGAVNTIITSRAGRDLVSSLAAGLLTIGPRFGGAINQAAGNWILGVKGGVSASDFVERFAAQKQYISGIGHKKYRSDNPDPRVGALLTHADKLSEKRFTKFAIEVEAVTTSKKGNLILNVDGTIAAVLLDILSEKEGLTDDELHRLVETEFFNALFVLSRSVGFISHFLDQKRLDEGLFRLDDDMVADASQE